LIKRARKQTQNLREETYQNIEKLIQGKKGPFIDKIRKILEE